MKKIVKILILILGISNAIASNPYKQLCVDSLDQSFLDKSSLKIDINQLIHKRWWSKDPKPTTSESIYSSMGNNPILNTDIFGDVKGEYDLKRNENGELSKNKISSLGDKDKIDFIHINEGENKGNTIIYNKNNGFTNVIKDGRKFIKDYTLRDENLNWSGIFNEWKNEDGPSNSMIYGRDNILNKSIMKSNLYLEARNNYLESQLIDKSKIKGLEYISFKPVLEGLKSIFLSGSNMTLQMLGTCNVSFYDIGNHQRIVLINDSKSQESFDRILPLSKLLPKIPQRVTRQTYIWIDNNVEGEN